LDIIFFDKNATNNLNYEIKVNATYFYTGIAKQGFHPRSWSCSGHINLIYSIERVKLGLQQRRGLSVSYFMSLKSVTRYFMGGHPHG
jgi:hypothetical protein